jgi:hypothetical protein
MGWWKDGDDLLGDGPTDLFQDGLTEFNAEHGKPSWQQLLNALDAALNEGRLHAEFAPGEPELWSDAKHAEPVLRDTLQDLLQQIREEYQERRRRQPTLSELLGTVRFSLAGRPESFLAATAAAIKKLRVEKPT